MDLERLVPAHKDDHDAVERLTRVVAEHGFGPELHDVIPELLGWVADMHWSVASAIGAALAKSELALVEPARAVLVGSDYGWTRGVTQLVLAQASPTVQRALLPELESLARGRDLEDAWLAAQDILDELSPAR